MKGIIDALRFRTIPLSVSGVIMGLMLAAADYKVAWGTAIMTVLTAISLQLLSNASNELGDYLSGTDRDSRVGPKRSLQSGNLTVKGCKILIFCCAVLTIICGLIMIWLSFGSLFCLESILLMILGIAAMSAAMRYTLGKSPYGYRGLGDIYVFLFFGLAAVLGSYFVAAHTLKWIVFLPAVAIGAFSVAVLNVNNIRDYHTDIATRVTIPIKIGIPNAKIYQTVLIIVGWVAMLTYSVLRIFDPWHYLFVITLPLYIWHLVGVWTLEGKKLDAMLPLLVMSTFIFALLTGIGYLIFLF